jgi:hypothetical protein
MASGYSGALFVLQPPERPVVVAQIVLVVLAERKHLGAGFAFSSIGEVH